MKNLPAAPSPNSNPNPNPKKMQWKKLFNNRIHLRYNLSPRSHQQGGDVDSDKFS